MREKGHQNWPLVIRLWYDPHLPFSGESISKSWSKWDMSSSNPPLQRMSTPHCPTAITSCEPGSFQTKACLFMLTSTATEREMQHIYEIIWHLLFHYERENCVRNMWHQKNGLMLFLFPEMRGEFTMLQICWWCRLKKFSISSNWTCIDIIIRNLFTKTNSFNLRSMKLIHTASLHQYNLHIDPSKMRLPSWC